MKLPILDLTPQAFATYGKVIEMPNREVDSSGPGWQWWGGNALMDDAGPYAIGYLSLEPAALRIDWAERHLNSMELLIPTGGDCLVHVGPPEHLDQPDWFPALAQFQIFRVRQGQGVLLERGVWHGAPLALDQALNVVVLLQQNAGQDDTVVMYFEETPLLIENE